MKFWIFGKIGRYFFAFHFLPGRMGRLGTPYPWKSPRNWSNRKPAIQLLVFDHIIILSSVIQEVVAINRPNTKSILSLEFQILCARLQPWLLKTILMLVIYTFIFTMPWRNKIDIRDSYKVATKTKTPNNNSSYLNNIAVNSRKYCPVR